jgi:DNA-binding transcriptional LysR family regulator
MRPTHSRTFGPPFLASVMARQAFVPAVCPDARPGGSRVDATLPCACAPTRYLCHAACVDWNDIRVFRAVARARSLAQGAREAGLDRSTASRRIACLEEALGARLFLRTRQGLRLSPAGERLAVHAERVAAEARALEASAADEARHIGGLVRIATTQALATMLVSEGLLSLRTRHPALEIELLGGNRAVEFARGEADFALRSLAGP